MAVLRCENLTGDASLDWMGRGFSEILRIGLSGSPSVNVVRLGTLRTVGRALGPTPPQAPGISAERQAAVAAGATRAVYCYCTQTGGRLQLSAVMEDLIALRSLQAVEEQGEPRDFLPIAGRVAQRLGVQGRRSLTNSREALERYAQGLDAGDLAAAQQDFARAVASDPNFGAAYVEWLQTTLAQRDRAGAERILQMAQARGNAIPEFERARLALDAAEMRGDAAARAAALVALARLDPTDPNIVRGLAETALAARRYRESLDYYRKARELVPDDPLLLNAIGYASAYAGDYEAAMEALHRYEKLQPTNANPLDSQGDVNFMFGRFAEAEKFYVAAQEKDPNFLASGDLLKAAQARLMTGDIPGADSIFERYAAAIASRGDITTDYRRAQWQYLSGRRRPALATLEKLAANMESRNVPPVASLAHAQAAIYLLALGDGQRAREHAARSAAGAAGPAGAVAALAIFLTQAQPITADRLGPLQDLATAYGFLFGKQFAQAVPVLQKLYDRSNPTNEEGLPVFLAWALMESGASDRAGALLQRTPPPLPTGVGTFQFLWIPRLLFLRGELAAKQGKAAQVKQNYELFLKLAGSDAEIWGEEARARK